MKDGPERVVTYHGGHRGTFPERIIFTALPSLSGLSTDIEQGWQRWQCQVLLLALCTN
jgi:hypothetical protein